MFFKTVSQMFHFRYTCERGAKRVLFEDFLKTILQFVLQIQTMYDNFIVHVTILFNIKDENRYNLILLQFETMPFIYMKTIRKSQQTDCLTIYNLICDMEAQTLPYETFEEIYSRQLENDCYICLVYEINGEVIGCINLRMEYQLHHAGTDMRDYGIGGTLRPPQPRHRQMSFQCCLQ